MANEKIMTSTGEELNLEKTKRETDRKCPQCGGVMDFDPKTGGLHCPYCDYAEEIKQEQSGEEGPAQELDYASAEKTENCDWGAKKKVVICKACGAESVYDELQIANECPYCGSNQVMEEKNEQTMAPGGVVPFKLTAKEAASKFTSWIKGKLFCPRAAKESAKPGAFKGVYLPYWTFDAHTKSRYEGEYGIDRKVRRGKDEEEIVTDWYSTSGTYVEDFDDELVLASGRYEQSLMSDIEPFNTADNKSYKPEYVAGFIAERYSVGLKEAFEKAKEFIKKKLEANIEDKIRREHHADHSRVKRVETRYSAVTYKYLLLPVWLSSYQYKGKVYHYMVNGQTGKAGGETPTSWLRVVIAVALLCAIGFLVSEYVEVGIVFGVITLILTVICYFTKM
ncbi:MAG: hypothetical protein IJ390_11235 [Lachnospiraceae bacterium]|nr:hypothetical protein [Lachnospiraceae bacterium]